MSIEIESMDNFLEKEHKKEEDKEVYDSNFDNIVDDLKIVTMQVTQVTIIKVAAAEQIEDVDEEFQNMLNDLKVVKKKKKKETVGHKETAGNNVADGPNGPKNTEKDMGNKVSPEEEYVLYKIQLSNIYRKLEKNNPDLVKRLTLTIPIPKVLKSNGDKVIISNFGEICKVLNRDPQHVLLYLESELSTITRLYDNKLAIKGVFRPSYIQTMLSKYIKEYVTCLSCNSLNTKVSKLDRLSFIVCSICNSSRTLQPIKKGYSALTKYTK